MVPNMIRSQVPAQQIIQAAKKTATKPDQKIAKLQKKLAELKTAVGPQVDREANNFDIVTEVYALNRFVDNALAAGEVVIDVETTGLNPVDDDLVGIAMYTPGQKPIYIPLKHKTVSGNYVAGQFKVMKTLNDALWRLSRVSKYFHNAKFDIRFLKRVMGDMYELEYCNDGNRDWDCFLAHKFLNENEPAGLKYLYDKYVNPNKNESTKTFSELFNKLPIDYVPIKIAAWYATKDVVMTYELAKFQQQFLDPACEQCRKKGLVDAAKFYTEVELPLINVVARMEDNGIAIDAQYADELKEKYTKQLQAAEMVFNKEVIKLDLAALPEEKRKKLSVPVNINSPTQLAILFYDVLGFTSPDPDKPRGTGDEILTYFLGKHKKCQKLLEAVRDYRANKKLLSTYIEKFPELVSPKTGRLHGNFNQGGTVTGRFSSDNPNLQNIPARNKDIRQMVVPSEGCYLLAADYSQQEPRVLAHVSGDSRLVGAYKEGKDIYAWMASQLYNLPYEECLESYSEEAAKRRQSTKAIVLGLMYGMGVNGLADSLGVSRDEAAKIVAMFFDTFPTIRDTIRRLMRQVRATGYVQTVYGRKRRLPDFNLPPVVVRDKKTGKERPDLVKYYEKLLGGCYTNNARHAVIKQANRDGVIVEDNGGNIAYAKRQILNSVIQGTSAEITKKAMLAIHNYFKDDLPGFKILLTVHDEIICEVPRDYVTFAQHVIRDIMVRVAEDRISVPMAVDVEIYDRWYGNKLVKEDITKDLGEG